jgi:hypothetical protein
MGGAREERLKNDARRQFLPLKGRRFSHFSPRKVDPERNSRESPRLPEEPGETLSPGKNDRLTDPKETPGTRARNATQQRAVGEEEGAREEGRAAERAGGREGEKEGAREGAREEGREGGREGEKEGGREGGKGGAREGVGGWEEAVATDTRQHSSSAPRSPTPWK